MVVVLIMRMFGDPDELFAAVRGVDEVAAPKARAGGGTSHTVARADDGLVMVNLWETQEAADALNADPEVLRAVDEAMRTVRATRPPVSESYEVLHHEVV